MRRLMLAFALTISLAAGAPAARANLIVNGSFEDPGLTSPTSWAVFQNIPGWNSVHGAGIEIQHLMANVVVPQDGLQYVELDSDGSGGGLPNVSTNSAMAQVLWLTPGVYELSFWHRPRTSMLSDNVIDVYFNDVDAYGYFERLVASADGISSQQDFWKQYVYTLNVPTADSYALTFRASGSADKRGGLIDNVSLRQVPEPPMLAALSLGLILGLIGVARLRRR